MSLASKLNKAGVYPSVDRGQVVGLVKEVGEP